MTGGFEYDITALSKREGCQTVVTRNPLLLRRSGLSESLPAAAFRQPHKSAAALFTEFSRFLLITVDKISHKCFNYSVNSDDFVKNRQSDFNTYNERIFHHGFLYKVRRTAPR